MLMHFSFLSLYAVQVRKQHFDVFFPPLIILILEFRLVILETSAGFLQHVKIVLLLDVQQLKTWYVVILIYLVRKLYPGDSQ